MSRLIALIAMATGLPIGDLVACDDRMISTLVDVINEAHQDARRG